ncbi:hypothetical protein LEMLEM_LOCUS22640 [Lemmus lemmus]
MSETNHPIPGHLPVVLCMTSFPEACFYPPTMPTALSTATEDNPSSASLSQNRRSGCHSQLLLQCHTCLLLCSLP